MKRRKKENSIKIRSVSMKIIPFFFVLLVAFFIPTQVLGEEEYDINSPQVEMIADQLSMDGHEIHDLATCATKQRYYEEITDLLNEGYNEDQVLEYYVGMYGEQGLRAPNKSGFSLLAWILPFVAIVIVGVILIVSIRKRMNKSKTVYEEEFSGDKTEDEITSSYIDDERKKYY